MTSQSVSYDGSSAAEVIICWEMCVRIFGKVQEQLLGIWLKMIECFGGGVVIYTFLFLSDLVQGLVYLR